ncbi:8038_t:CDS:1 [Cetraspora pellucida]|uniref:8038_t:CDS:1 n=1 Tax=Cetraspora pellucida TaxID=1433469 RepID=A0A9N9A751_9GLOM|nr:8038_t:CDS:1 [Cetraspora pellucida]
MTKKNLGPCSVRNCQINPKQYCEITDNAFRKAKEKGTFSQYNYLEIRKQLCYPHYLEIIEPNHHNVKKSPTNNLQDSVVRKPLSFGDKITLMTKILYNKQRKENQILELDPTYFQTMLESAEPLLEGFFDELCNAFISERWSAYNKKEDKKKVVNICYSIVAMRNRLVNNYPLEIGLYLAASGASCDAIDTMH